LNDASCPVMGGEKPLSNPGEGVVLIGRAGSAKKQDIKSCDCHRGV